jgi:pimeloyl-ACP methyl ester carboxylesterase
MTKETMMKGNIVRVTAEDGLMLQGFVGGGEPTPMAVVHIHGSYGNFFENFFLDNMAEAFESMGMTFASIGTRGRDYYADYKIKRDEKYESVRIGGIGEVFQESQRDIAAWLSFLRDRGTSHFILQGHSLGAMKAVFYAKLHPKDAAGLVLISPADTFGRRRMSTKGRLESFVAVARALAAVDPAAMMPSGAYYEAITAANYLGLYGQPEETAMFDYSNPALMREAGLGDLDCPVLATFATEGEAVVHPLPDCIAALRSAMRHPERLSTEIIEGANHSYHFRERELTVAITGWLERHWSLKKTAIEEGN